VVYPLRLTLTLCDMDSTSYIAYDNVWLKPRYNTQCKSHGYDYIIVHVDDFMIHLYEIQTHTWPNYNNNIKSDSSS